MKTTLHFLPLSDFKTSRGQRLSIALSYELFGEPLGEAPIVLITHALSGNSHVAGDQGWWKALVGPGKAIDLNRFTVLCFNIPGNGYDGQEFEDPYVFTLATMAHFVLEGLKVLGISRLHAIVGGSIGGALGWELLVHSPQIARHFIPIASHYRTTDWLYSNCLIQTYLLQHSKDPIQKARAHAMLCYRTPASLNERFKDELVLEGSERQSTAWLNYHGTALNERFSLNAYRLMNHLLMHVNIESEQLLAIEAHIHLIGVSSDLFFPAKEIRDCEIYLLAHHKAVDYYEIESNHGHDAFLIEYQQLNTIINSLAL